MFDLFNDRGIWMTFKNGVTISIQWGEHNYCGNREINESKMYKRTSCETAEIAIFDSHNKWITKGIYKHFMNEDLNDEVRGHRSADKVGELISICMSMDENDITICRNLS